LVDKPAGETDNIYAGWAVDHDTLNRIAQRWQKIADLCAYGHEDTEPLIRVVSPGKEAPSAYIAAKANASGAAYRDALRKLRIYAQEQADNCKKANQIYAEGDKASKAHLMKSVPVPAEKDS
jgi:hypothetical protein